MFLLAFILILIVLILVHEFGHFSVAKLFGIRVEEFGIGFPPRIAGKKFGETLYSVNWILAGGFVKIYGEDVPPAGGEGEKDPRSFAHKNRAVQAAVLVAGIVFNVIFAWLLLSVGYMFGMPTAVGDQYFGQVENPRIEIGALVPGSPAQKAGLAIGDEVTAVETGHATLPQGATADDLRAFIAAHQDESMVVSVERDHQQLNFIAKPAEGIASGKKALGVNLLDVGVLKLPPHLAVLQGAAAAKDLTVTIATGLASFIKQIFMGTANYSDVAGPIGIAGIGAMAVREGYAASIAITALISINLAIVNLIPIPGLDGGRLFITAIEAVIRRQVPQRITLWLSLVGFGLLILLMLVVSFHDIKRLIG